MSDDKVTARDPGLTLTGEQTVHFHINSPSYALLTLKTDGSYELPGTVEELLAHEHAVVRAFGAALRDHYEAGRRGEPAPTSGQA